MTGLTPPAANDSYKDDRPVKLVVEGVNVRDILLVDDPITQKFGFRIPNLVL